MRRGCGLSLFNLEKTWQELIALFGTPNIGFRVHGASLSSEGHHKRTRSKRHKLLRGKFCLDQKNKRFTGRVV